MRRDAHDDAAERPHARAGTRSLFLQQLLYYNAFFAAAWLVASVASAAHKGSGMVDAAVLAAFCLVEPARLSTGFSGNLQEQVPSLLGFVLLTAFFALPLALYFFALGSDVRAFDQALNIVAMLFYAVEVAAGAAACSSITQSQAEKFYLLDFAQYQAAIGQAALPPSTAARVAGAPAAAPGSNSGIGRWSGASSLGRGGGRTSDTDVPASRRSWFRQRTGSSPRRPA